MHRPVLIEAPSELPVSVEECKNHAVVEYDDDNTLIEGYISAAVAMLDGFSGIMGRCIVNQKWSRSYDRFERPFFLRIPDVSAVKLKYLDPNGIAQEVPPEDLEIRPIATGTVVSLRAGLDTPPIKAGSVVDLVFTAGFGDADAVPKNIKIAIMQIVARFNDDRSGEVEGIGPAATQLITPFRWARV